MTHEMVAAEECTFGAFWWISFVSSSFVLLRQTIIEGICSATLVFDNEPHTLGAQDLCEGLGVGSRLQGRSQPFGSPAGGPECAGLNRGVRISSLPTMGLCTTALSKKKVVFLEGSVDFHVGRWEGIDLKFVS